MFTSKRSGRGWRTIALALAMSATGLTSVATAQIGDQAKRLLKDPLFQTAKKGLADSYTLENGIVVKLKEKKGYLLSATLVAPKAIAMKAKKKDESKEKDKKEKDKADDNQRLEEVTYVVGVITGYGQDIAKPLFNYLKQDDVIEQMAKPGGTSIQAPPIQIKASRKGETLSLDLAFAKVDAKQFPKVKTVLPAQRALGRKVILRVVSDFQCPYCTKFEVEALSKLIANKPQDLQIEFHHLPLEGIHPQARGAAEASECASQQGKFWPFKDALFQDKKMQWAKDNPNIAFINLATKLKLDVRQFKDCLAERGGKKVVDASLAATAKMQISGTPTVLVNGYKVANPFDVEKIRKLIDFARAVD